MENIKGMYQQTYDVTYYDVGEDKNILPMRLVAYMQEASTEHTNSVGCTADYQMENGFGWVLLENHTIIERMPKLGEKIQIRTWPCKKDRVFFYRQYEVSDEKGNIIARATTKWILYSLKNKEVIFVNEEIANMFPTVDYETMPNTFIKKVGEKSENTVKKCVQYQDVDTNWHMNNIAYLKYAFGSMGTDYLRKYEVAEFDVNYVHQIKHCEFFDIFIDKKEENEYVYSIRKENSKEIKDNCIVYVKWREKIESNN